LKRTLLTTRWLSKGGRELELSRRGKGSKDSSKEVAADPLERLLTMGGDRISGGGHSGESLLRVRRDEREDRWGGDGERGGRKATEAGLKSAYSGKSVKMMFLGGEELYRDAWER